MTPCVPLFPIVPHSPPFMRLVLEVFFVVHWWQVFLRLFTHSCDHSMLCASITACDSPLPLLFLLSNRLCLQARLMVPCLPKTRGNILSVFSKTRPSMFSLPLLCALLSSFSYSTFQLWCVLSLQIVNVLIIFLSLNFLRALLNFLGSIFCLSLLQLRRYPPWYANFCGGCSPVHRFCYANGNYICSSFYIASRPNLSGGCSGWLYEERCVWDCARPREERGGRANRKLL